MIEYVKDIIFPSSDSALSIAGSLLGIAGISLGPILGLILAKIKSRKIFELSIKKLQYDLNERDKIISNYRELVAKENIDLKLFIKLFPIDMQDAHAVQHFLYFIHSLTPQIFNGMKAEGGGQYGLRDEHEQIFEDFVKSLFLFLGRKKLILANDCSCARTLISQEVLTQCLAETMASKKMQSLEKLVDLARLDRRPPWSDMGTDINEIDYLYKIMKGFESKENLDVMLASKIVKEASEINHDNEFTYVRQLKEEMNYISDGYLSDNSDIYHIIPNTIISIYYVKNIFGINFDDICNLSDEYIKNIFIEYNSKNIDAIINPTLLSYIEFKFNN